MSNIIPVPRFVLPLRVLQFVFALAILGMSAYGLYWVRFDAWGLAVFTSLATFIIVSYGLLTQAIRSLQSAYNYWAILALEIFAIIFWLATMALLASTRAAFIYPAYISGCYNDGYGGYCYAKRDTYVATNGYLNMMSAAAGFSAIELILFIATLVIFALNLKRHRAANAPPAGATTTTGAGPTPEKLEAQPPVQMYAQQPQGPPMPQQQQQQQQQYQPQQQHPGQMIQPGQQYPQVPTPVPYTPSQSPGPQYAPPSPLYTQPMAPPPQQPTVQQVYSEPPQGYSEVSAEGRNRT